MTQMSQLLSSRKSDVLGVFLGGGGERGYVKMINLALNSSSHCV